MIVADQLGNEVALPGAPEQLKIVSVVPSQTELLHYLGANVIGQTIFCVKPEEQFKKATKVGGTKKLRIDRILKLQPDLVIGNKEENDKDQIEELSRHVPVWMSDIYTLRDALDMIRSIGRITGKETKANALITRIESNFTKLKSRIRNNGTAAYLIWNDPVMLAGRKTFIEELVRRAGFTNVIADPESRYPELSMEQLADLQPENILLSSEPFPFKSTHAEFFKKQFPGSTVRLVDGAFFSWYGNRLEEFPDYLERHFPALLTN